MTKKICSGYQNTPKVDMVKQFQARSKKIELVMSSTESMTSTQYLRGNSRPSVHYRGWSKKPISKMQDGGSQHFENSL